MESRPARWQLLAALIVVVGLLVAAGCGGDDSAAPAPADPTPAEPSDPAPADPEPAPADSEPAPADPESAPADPEPAPADPEAAPAEGQTLVVAITNTPPDLDTASSAQFIENEINSAVYDRLFDFAITEDADGNFIQETEGIAPVVGKLAESWETTDNQNYTIQLRQGVLSPSGTELTCADIEYTFDRALSLAMNGTFYLGAIAFSSLDNFECVDDYTFTMSLDEPNVLFFKMLSIPLLAILDSGEYMANATEEDPWATEWARSNSAGFGPYQMTENTPGQQVVLEANPNYWNGVPPVTTVIMREVPDSANRAALVKSGEVDVAQYLTARERESLMDDENVRIVSFAPAQQKSVLWMTNDIAPFDNKLVRQAVCYALPYDDIVNAVTVGSGQRQFGVMPANYEFYAPETYGYNYDPDMARELLAEAGFADGFSTEIAFSTAAPEDEQQMEIVAQALGDIGIDAQLNKLPLATFNEGWLGGQFPMGTLFEGAFVPDFTYALRLWYYGEDNFLNYMNYNSPEVNALLDEARSTFEDAEREALAVEAQQIINDDAPVCTMIEPGVHYAVGSDVTGVNYFTYSSLHFDLMSKG